MKNLLLAVLCCAALGVFAQYDDERFPVEESELAIIKKNNVASLVITETTGGRTTTTTTHYNKNGFLTYKHEKTSSEKIYHYKYDKQNRLTEIVDSSYDAVFKKWWSNTTSFSYFKSGLLKERTLNTYSTTFSLDEKLNKLTSIQPEDAEAGTLLEYYYNEQHKLLKTIKKEQGETETTTVEYDGGGRAIKEVVYTDFTHAYDSSVKNTTYSNNGLLLKTENIIVKASAMLDDEGEVIDGPLEIEKETNTMTYVYDDKNRILHANYVTDKVGAESWESTSSYSIENGIETQKIIQKTNNKTSMEATIVYNGPKGLKSETKHTEFTKNGPTETSITFTYTFHK